ncbi:RNA polymerase sigma factor [Aldersonia sp. NBC_00410]|uniref:RNA polymerase sigma factor n=1 Tax=Aldersonia sp. NBC_00410 TaxID=2975954 RepID=UPI002254A425|nr:RNA polymerase sigma factor [Aldersonia sp. NBC_00410]MCX5044826.1 RNA polymerase sigma factor [Aldersonia sp. NBC_00410]MCX5046313.1 RNA polymerase sigma factor [Aldersonia sp. NBC_00410]
MSETELLARCRDGDRAAFAELIAPQRQSAWNISLRITGNREDAEDALQNALIAAWQNLGKFNGEARFGTWFYRVVSNAAIDIHRRRAARIATDFVDPTELVDLTTASSAPSVEDRVVDVDAVRRALAELPAEFREAIVLREFTDLSYAEIAEHQGIGVQTVKSRISRGRTQLEALLAA